jgi:hypothetical protein
MDADNLYRRVPQATLAAANAAEAERISLFLHSPEHKRLLAEAIAQLEFGVHLAEGSNLDASSLRAKLGSLKNKLYLANRAEGEVGEYRSEQ